MSNERISEEELHALLGEGLVEKVSPLLSSEEEKAVGETFGKSMKQAMMLLSTILRKDVSISDPKVSVLEPAYVKAQLPRDAILVELEYRGGLVGPAAIFILKDSAAVIADLMVGRDGTAPAKELDQMHIEALNEAFSQMLEVCNEVLTEVTGKRIELAPIKIKTVDLVTQQLNIPILSQSKVVQISYNMRIENLTEGMFMQLLPVNMAKSIIEQPKPQMVGRDRGVHPVRFAELSGHAVAEVPSNIRILMDVPMEVSVELGRKKMLIKDVLNLGVGSIVELEKLSDEPVDILVNGKLVAKGTVVVVDGNFGVRISDILTPMERLEETAL